MGQSIKDCDKNLKGILKVLSAVIITVLFFLLSFRKVDAAFIIKSYDEITLNKPITDTIGDEWSDDYIKNYRFEIDKKQTLQLCIQSLSKIENPENISIYIIDESDEEIVNLYIPFAHSTKVLKNVTLSKGIYYIQIYNGGNFNPYKYKLSINKTTKTPTDVSIDNNVTIKVGTKYQLQAKSENAILINYSTIVWKSSDTSVATVNKYGQVTAKKKGKCKISVTLDNGKSVYCNVTVPKPTIDEQLRAQKVYARYDYIDAENIYNDCIVELYNNSSKDITYIEIEIITYDNREYSIETLLCDYNYTIESKEMTTAIWWVSTSAQEARVCIKKVWFKDKTTWTNPLYKTWHNKYK